MNIRTLLSTAILATLMMWGLSSCSREDRNGCCKEKYIVFKSNISAHSEARVSGSRFDLNDQIGVYMRGDKSINNAHYYANKGGAVALFYPLDKKDQISLTCDCETVDFFAYAPYQEAVRDAKITVDLQTNPIDLLYATHKQIKGDSERREHTLTFSHVLSRVIFTLIDAPAGQTVQSVKLKGVVPQATFDLITGSWSMPQNTNIELPLTILDTKLSATSLLIPANVRQGLLSLTMSDGKEYTFPIEDLSIEDGKLYFYNIYFKEGGSGGSSGGGSIFVDFANGSIRDWDSVDGGTLDLLPTEEKPEPEPQPEPTPSGVLAPGSDFENFDAFLTSLNKYKLKPYATLAAGAGIDASAALHVKGTPSTNEYLFTITHPEGVSYAGKKYISFFIKGTAGKSLSMNVNKKDGKYAAFNLDAIGDKGHIVTPADAPIVLQPNPKINPKTGSGTNSYANGSIDTKGQWLQIKLDISSIELATKEDLFSIKVGSSAAYDLYLDNITIE